MARGDVKAGSDAHTLNARKRGGSRFEIYLIPPLLLLMGSRRPGSPEPRRRPYSAAAPLLWLPPRPSTKARAAATARRLLSGCWTGVLRLALKIIPGPFWFGVSTG